MGAQHIEAVRRVPGVEVVALADEKPALAQQTCQENGVPHAYGDYRELLEREKPDAVHICTPNFTHYQICADALEAGAAVFCEKPLSSTSEQAGALVRLAEEKGLAAGVNFNYRQNAMVREMGELARAPEWGRTFLLRGEYIQDWMMYDTDYNWRCVPEVNGPSRTVADVGSHWFDAAQFVTGQRVARVLARLVTVHPRRKKFTGQARTFEAQPDGPFELVDITSEDAAFILFELTDGTPGVLTLSQVSAGYKNGMVLSVDGAAGSMTWEQENPDKLIVRTREGGAATRYAAAGGLHGQAARYAPLPAGHAVGWADGLKNSVGAFYAHLITGEPPRFATFAQGAQVVRIVEACLESHRTGRWTQVKEG